MPWQQRGCFVPGLGHFGGKRNQGRPVQSRILKSQAGAQRLVDFLASDTGSTESWESDGDVSEGGPVKPGAD